ncbi:MAG: threonine--tRNA ligase [Deltaproteobacteria bacterium]|nr:threonine--tRNA ligase [Deltaproteobacteria bacterium]
MQSINIEGEKREFAQGTTCGEALKSSLSGKRYKSALAAECNGTTLDLSSSLPLDCTELAPITADTPAGLELLRHSAAHVLAAAVQKLFPGVKVTIGPSIESGFYYDFDYSRPFTPEDFPAIEAEMQKIIDANQPYCRREISRNEAVRYFSDLGETYKVELIENLPENAGISIYDTGDFADLCRGPHIPSSGQIKAFKLLSVAGAYCRGDEKRPMLSRIYGTAFASQDDLKAYLHMLEEAKKRDHRRLGPELGLFEFHEEFAPGMVFWLPKGMMLRMILEDFHKKEHLKRGYQFVQGPQILRKEAWVKSGHYDNYRENMYFTEIEGDVHAVKPMNCVGHMLMYNSTQHSYRELPVRMAELGLVHRHEMSGALHGLLRVRQFTQDDAHIICTPEQLEDEIIGIVRYVQDVFGLFGFEYSFDVSTRPEKSLGNDEIWDMATTALIKALERINMPYRINEGDGAFYGPKIDGKVKDSLGRMWQCSTIQVDFNLPERFDLNYIGNDGEKHRPVMLHRTILGSIERFIGVLTEHTAGKFPIWLAPVQAKLLNVTEGQEDFVREAAAKLERAGIRVESDLRNEKLGYKVRQAQMEKIPYILVVGDKEVEAGGVNVRLNNGDTIGLKSLDEFAALVREAAEEPFKRGGMSYSFS